MSMGGTYPFTAIVGQDDMKAALCLNAIHPGIGGVLISGERGTAKTTAVRALPALLGGGIRVVELPLNATEDRIVGTLHVGALMKTGERVFSPGLLAEADGNVLYVDEINLLEDHIVDLLLDAAATGVCHIEREGVSQVYPARFVLVGTMNPEEGTLRPQLLDRFGLSVVVSGSLTREQRLELVRRRAAYDADPEGFCAEFAETEKQLAERIARGAELYPGVSYPDDMARLAAGLCSRIGVDGYRADITLMRTARAAAAFEGRNRVSAEDVLFAARFVLPHRVKRLPFEEAQLGEAALRKAFDAELSLIDGSSESPDASEEPDGRIAGPDNAAEPEAESPALGMQAPDLAGASRGRDLEGQGNPAGISENAQDDAPKAPGQRGL